MTKPAKKAERVETYLFLHGISVPRTVQLDEFIELRPASGVPSPDTALQAASSSEDAAALLLFLPRISSELHIRAASEKELAARVWNAGWDALLLGSIFSCQVEQRIESQHSAADVSGKTALRITNYHLFGWQHPPKEIEESDCVWLERHFHTARSLVDQEPFRNSVHCLASYHWHPHPRARLALLWAGIEGLFRIESELSFRLSLCAAKFLEPTDRERALQLFAHIKKLYSSRSKAVHGGVIKGDSRELVQQSAGLLHSLLRQTVEAGQLPDAEDLIL